MTRFLLLCLLLASPAFAAPGVRVCAVGDSITAGFAPSTYGWTVPLAQMNASLDWGVKNVAVPGAKVNGTGMLNANATFLAEIPGRRCTWVVFLVGTNNLPDGTSAAAIWAGIKAMVDAARAEGAKVALLAILPRGTGPSWSTDLGTRLLAVNASMQAYATTTAPAIVYVDT
ncbi:MAG TPA: SGNH/GDSL hydrolase family protein, partial [Archangium sp.]|nr:SGNH/GDSL hydrolase family protein [Archangium sp.]